MTGQDAVVLATTITVPICVAFSFWINRRLDRFTNDAIAKGNAVKTAAAAARQEARAHERDERTRELNKLLDDLGPVP